MSKAPRGYTFDPCPGCTKSDDQKARPKNGVCEGCRRILDAHARAQREVKDESLVAVAVPTMPHWLPYIRDDKAGLREKFHALAIALSTPSNGSAPKLAENSRIAVVLPGDRDTSNWSPYKDEDYRVMPTAVALAMRELFTGILVALPAAYDEGKSEGRNLLAMLSKGELTNPEFERRAGITNGR